MHTETEANQVKERRAVADWTQCSWLLALFCTLIRHTLAHTAPAAAAARHERATAVDRATYRHSFRLCLRYCLRYFERMGADTEG